MIGNRTLRKAVTLMSAIILVLSMSLVIYGEESDLVTIEVNDTTIDKGTSLILKLTMDSSIEATEIGVEGLENFEIDSTSQSSSSSNINGVKTSSYTYELRLSPKSVGEFTLRAVVNDGQKVYESKPLVVTVSERDQNLDDEDADVFIKTVMEDKEFYFGENIVLTYELYSRYNLDDFGFLDEVTYNGFIVESTAKEDLESNIVTINGSKYLKQIVKEDVLVPTSTGEFQIPPYRFQANLSTGDFFSRSEPRYLDTQATSIVVKELPANNKPTEFTNIIGDLDIKYAIDHNEITYGDAITLNVLLTGTGNVSGIGQLYKDTRDNITIYETEKQTNRSIIDQQLIESKEYEIIIVPDDTGELVLSAVELWYFDTDLNDYSKVEIPEQIINVTGTKAIVNETSPSQEEVQTIVVNQINTHTDPEVITIQFSKKSAQVVGLIILVVLLIPILWWLFKHKKTEENKKLKVYLKMLKQVTTIDLLEEFVAKYVVDKTGMNLKSNHRKDITAKFKGEQVQTLMEEIILDLEKDKVNVKQELNSIIVKVQQVIELNES